MFGSRKGFPGTKTIIALQKEKNKELSPEEKEHNKSYSIKRMVIEHTICRLKSTK
jgi:hypothetical protein